jgi:hypothetical protein
MTPFGKMTFDARACGAGSPTRATAYGQPTVVALNRQRSRAKPLFCCPPPPPPLSEPEFTEFTLFPELYNYICNPENNHPADVRQRESSVWASQIGGIGVQTFFSTLKTEVTQ